MKLEIKEIGKFKRVNLFVKCEKFDKNWDTSKKMFFIFFF